ncbi:MAG: putative transcriptional response regulator protein [Dehalococcoidales bacterium]|nr:putative transcriptional response regulator protein [Dehalococcoidales bacterium]
MDKLILIAEDEPKNAKLIGDLLRIKGYRVVEATDGKQAVELCRVMKPDMILMDIMMPVMNGLEATKAIRGDATTGNVPIIALTSLAMKGDKELILEAGCNTYISKPIDIKEFLKTVAKYFE